MPRYGDFDALFNERPEYLNPQHETNGEYNRGWNACNEHYSKLIRNAPTADVVEVVRCKDCAFWTYEGVGSSTLKRFGSCAKWYPFGNEQHNCHDEDFCSCGERRNDE